MMRLLLRISAHFIFLLSALFCNVILSEGFAADTLVGTPTGYTRIQDLSVDDAVTVYTFQTASASSRIVQSASNWGESIIRMGIDGEIIDMAEDQLLFIPLQRAWLPASAIREGMYLLGSPLRAVRVQSIEIIEQATRVYTLSLNHNHTYLVGKHGIVVHNFGELVLTVVEAAESVTLLNAFLAANPLVVPVTIAVGGAGLFGYVSWMIIDGFKQAHDAAKKSNDTEKNNNRSGMPPEEPKKPRNNERYSNMYEVFKKAVIGKVLQESSEPTSFYSQGAKIFRVVKDIAEYGIKKGDWFYLDKLHGDHIEVFKKCGKVIRTVLNIDGTQNLKKLANASARSIESCLK